MSIPDTSRISATIFSGEPFSFSFRYLSEKVALFINALFAKLLPKMDHIYLLDPSITILREICVNAVKANAKRLYFKTNNIDISNPGQYAEGLKLFKKFVIGQFEQIQADLQKSPYLVTVVLRKREQGLSIQVSNNVPILPEELDRVNMRMEKAREYEDFSEAFEDIYDESEGAGLGIVLVSLLLKNSGIGTENFRISSDGKYTSATLLIPQQLKPQAIITRVYSQIMEEVDGLPTFPEHILELQRLCSDPESSITGISERIMVDPALVSDILKLANSAGIFPAKRVENIQEAIKIIGMKNLNAILMTTGARRILDTRYSTFEQIWNHCNRTAFYARKLATRFKLGRVLENAFLGGLLHDLGKIVMLSTDINLTNRIADIVRNRKIRTSTVMEEISIGISHARLGELIAGKWGFPDYLVETIKSHHTPLEAPPRFRDLVFVVYMANMICGIESRRYQFHYLETDVLERFGIRSEEEFTQLLKEVQRMYEEESR